MTDERRGVPSASGLPRLVGCPNSFSAEQGYPDESTPDSLSGDKVHAFMAGTLAFDQLDSREQKTAEMCREQEDVLLSEWIEGNDWLEFRERRLGLTAMVRVLEVTPECKADFVFTGQADVVYVQGDRAAVFDYKTLHGDHPEAADNWQLLGLAVLVALHHKVKEVRVAIIQPWAGKPTVSDYSEHALVLTYHTLMEKLRAAKESTPADRRAGDWCKWCKAKLACETFKSAAIAETDRLDVINIAGLAPDQQTKALYARGMEMPAASLAAAVRGLGIISLYAATVKAVAKQRAETDPEFQQFYRLEEGKQGKRKIDGDAQEVLTALHSLGVTAEDVLKASSVSVTPLQDAVRKASGVKSTSTNGVVKYNLTDKDAGKAMEQALGPLLTRGAPSVELVPVTQQIEGGEQ